MLHYRRFRRWSEQRQQSPFLKLDVLNSEKQRKGHEMKLYMTEKKIYNGLGSLHFDWKWQSIVFGGYIISNGSGFGEWKMSSLPFVFWFFWWVGKKSFPFDVLSSGYFTLSPCRCIGWGTNELSSLLSLYEQNEEANEGSTRRKWKKSKRERVWYWKGREGGYPITVKGCVYINIYHVMLGGRVSGYSFPKDVFGSNQIARCDLHG